MIEITKARKIFKKLTVIANRCLDDCAMPAAAAGCCDVIGTCADVTGTGDDVITGCAWIEAAVCFCTAPDESCRAVT